MQEVPSCCWCMNMYLRGYRRTGDDLRCSQMFSAVLQGSVLHPLHVLWNRSLPHFLTITSPITFQDQLRFHRHVTISTAVRSLNINFQLRSSMNNCIHSQPSLYDSTVTLLDLPHILCLYLTGLRGIWELPVHMPAYLTATLHTQTDYLHQHKIEETDSVCCF